MTSQSGSDVPSPSEVLRRLLALEEREADRARLTDGVERLADETGGLNAILNKVDEQQQRLSTLGRDLQRVEKSKVSKVELKASEKKQAADTLDFRKKTLQRVYTTGILMLLTLGLVIGVIVQVQESRRARAVEQCESRNAQNDIIIDVLEGSVENAIDPDSAASVNIRDGLERFRSLILDCEDL